MKPIMSHARPFILDPLFRSTKGLPGIGPKNGKLLDRLIEGEALRDLIFHKPIDVIDRSYTPKISDATHGKTATLEITIEKHEKSKRRGLPYRVQAKDETGQITLIFFNAHPDYLEKHLPVGETLLVSGVLDRYQGQLQMTHPDYILPLSEKDQLPRLEPIYPMTQGLSPKTLQKAMHAALDQTPALPEWNDLSVIKRRKWQGWQHSIKALHKPENSQSLNEKSTIRERLAYDELLSSQLTLAILRAHIKKQKGRAQKGDNSLRDKIIANLPYQLTNAQKHSLAEISGDMAEPLKMLRLLQGDVGAGKTVVAVLAAAQAIESGAQAAIMAPTEILARQHFESISALIEPASIKAVILTGRDKGKARAEILERIENGDAQLIIGTHALFQDSITFLDLGLAVIDEQHRFGVHQRMTLSNKGEQADTLVMTATPIPRTLTLTVFGDMDVSRLDEKPAGRKPIDTRTLSLDRIEDLIRSLKTKISEGERIYWVCPLVEESEKIDLAAAEDRYITLEKHFGERVGLVHGKMKADAKDDVMHKFAKGDLDILVATTVIEVGVNVPEATIMVIEQAERFGLSQLHQLRGRVGRGSAQSHCFLVYGKLSETAKERLQIMRETEDGFLIAEKDLDLRGAGDILGTKQSGLPKFKLANLDEHRDLLQMARDDARLIIEKDPKLVSERGQALKVLLHLFDRQQAIQYFSAG